MMFTLMIILMLVLSSLVRIGLKFRAIVTANAHMYPYLPAEPTPGDLFSKGHVTFWAQRQIFKTITCYIVASTVPSY